MAMVSRHQVGVSQARRVVFQARLPKRQNAYFITKENIDDKGKFDTGLTVNVLTGIPRESGMPPSQYAVRFVGEVEKCKWESFKKWRCDGGPFNGVGCRYHDGPFTINTVLIANDKTGTLFLVIFEAPTKEWDEAWRFGEPIVKKLLIDDEI